LNQERADEERRGLVRWLRPEFQNPSGVSAMTQVGITDAAEEDAEPAAAPNAEAWPKKLPEQLAVVRDLVLRGPFGWGTTQVAASFKGAKSGHVEPVLESLAALGLIVGYETDAGKWWRAARPSVLPPQ
jgi:hypothetical protein